MLTENDIAPDVEQYQKFNKAYQSGKRDSDLPGLLKNKDEHQSRLLPVLGLMIHPDLALLFGLRAYSPRRALRPMDYRMNLSHAGSTRHIQIWVFPSSPGIIFPVYQLPRRFMASTPLSSQLFLWP
jgi:hypothetical protein